ncbi:MAG: GNAT family N-acetyltransferase [Lachnospiraceae bacterium]|nr:GNAT family N-acetyltransferase [Lachnospiraceae bacterium]
MEFRLAVMQDLEQLKDIYKEIIENMNGNGISIWDDIYPCEFFEEDIKNNRLYILSKDSEIISAFALCDTSIGENTVEWNDKHAKAMYLDRFGVNIKYSKKGIGNLMIAKAKEITRTLGAEYLRLFVVDINGPAIQLYHKNNFLKVNGVYDEVFDDGFILHEFGYEIKV